MAAGQQKHHLLAKGNGILTPMKPKHPSCATGQDPRKRCKHTPYLQMEFSNPSSVSGDQLPTSLRMRWWTMRSQSEPPPNEPGTVQHTSQHRIKHRAHLPLLICTLVYVLTAPGNLGNTGLEGLLLTSCCCTAASCWRTGAFSVQRSSVPHKLIIATVCCWRGGLPGRTPSMGSRANEPAAPSQPLATSVSSSATQHQQVSNSALTLQHSISTSATPPKGCNTASASLQLLLAASPWPLSPLLHSPAYISVQLTHPRCSPPPYHVQHHHSNQMRTRSLTGRPPPHDHCISQSGDRPPPPLSLPSLHYSHACIPTPWISTLVAAWCCTYTHTP